MTAPSAIAVAEALHQLADLVAAGAVRGNVVQADRWQAEQLLAGMSEVREWVSPSGRRHWWATLFGCVLKIDEVPTADALAEAMLWDADAHDVEAGRA